jgi:glycosyltransferase involved in cell wall biosynthesis
MEGPVQTAVATSEPVESRYTSPHVEGLSLCIPVYNESTGIAETISRCLACEPALLEAGVGALEVIVVDDGSQDDTAARVREFPVRLIQHQANRGYGAALKTAFAAARYELLGFLDADATYPPELFPALCRPVLEGDADLVIGSRMSGAESRMPWTRRLGNHVFARLLTVIGRTDVSDTASGMRVFRKKTLDLLSPLPDGLNLTPVMSTRAAHEAVRVVEIPIPYDERVGRSKLNVVKDGLRFLETIVWTAMTYNPVRILGLIGLAGIGTAGLVGLWLLLLRLQGVTTIGPIGTYAVFAAVVCGAAGVSTFALGASFNYLVSLFHHRPIRQGLFRRPILETPIEQFFLPSGVAAAAAGLGTSVVTLALSLRGWPIERLWLYLSGSAMLLLIGIQLCISWLEMSILRELSQRERVEESQP